MCQNISVGISFQLYASLFLDYLQKDLKTNLYVFTHVQLWSAAFEKAVEEHEESRSKQYSSGTCQHRVSLARFNNTSNQQSVM